MVTINIIWFAADGSMSKLGFEKQDNVLFFLHDG